MVDWCNPERESLSSMQPSIRWSSHLNYKKKLNLSYHIHWQVFPINNVKLKQCQWYWNPQFPHMNITEELFLLFIAVKQRNTHHINNEKKIASLTCIKSWDKKNVINKIYWKFYQFQTTIINNYMNNLSIFNSHILTG